MAERARTYRTRAVILRRRDYGDADRILTVFTPRMGRLELIAKGVRKTTSRRAGHLEPFTHVDLQAAHGRTWDIVTEATTVESFRDLRANLESIARAGYVAELVDAFSQADPEALGGLWDLFLLALRELDAGTADPDLLLRWFELHLLSLMGFQPELGQCLACGEPLQPVVNYLSLQAGGFYCPRCGEGLSATEPVEPSVLKVLRHLQRSAWPTVRGLRLRRETLAAVESILYRYLVTVLERQLRSAHVLRRLRAHSSV